MREAAKPGGIAPELATSPLYQKRVKEERELHKKNIKNMSIAERLMLRTYNQTTTVMLDDPSGTIKLEMSTWTVNEIDTFTEAISNLKDKTALGKKARANVYGFLSEMCIDKSITREFLESGKFSIATFIEIRNGIINGEAETVMEARNFRTD